jgi:hypothetical protein
MLAKSNGIPAGNKRQFGRGRAGAPRFQKKNGQRQSLWPGGDLGAAYFLAVQVGQVAQVALASVQHFMPQAAVAVPVAQHFLEAQPATRAAVQTIRARSLIDFMFFILLDRLPLG